MTHTAPGLEGILWHHVPFPGPGLTQVPNPRVPTVRRAPENATHQGRMHWVLGGRGASLSWDCSWG